jgi:hypothetical protein
MSDLKCRFVEPSGEVFHFVVYSKGMAEGGCYHRTEFPITEAEFDNDYDRLKAQYAGKETTCGKCGQVFAPVGHTASGTTQWNTEDGKLHPGDMWWVKHLHDEDGRCRIPGWEDCDPRGHLNVMLPNGRVWDIDSRASNCTMKEDKNHRCWVRHGEPPHITVDKDGVTCQAGAGSIQAGDYHGFLQDGEIRLQRR